MRQEQDRNAARQRTPFVALLSANAVSQFGSMFSFVALPWFVLQTTGSASKAGISVAVDGIPIFIAGLLGGAIVDRLGYKSGSVLSDLLSAIAMAAIPFIYVTMGITFWQLLILVFFGALVAQPGRTAQSSLIPELAESSGVTLARANSLAQAIRRAALLFGPPLAGLLIAIVGASNALWIDAASYVVSAFIVTIGVPRTLVPVERSESSMLSGTFDGFRYLLRDRLLLAIAISTAAASIISEPLYAIVFPVYARQILHSAVSLGLMYSALALGSLGGLGLYTVLGDRLPRRVILLGGMSVAAACYWVLVTEPSLPLLLATIVIDAVCFEPINPLVSSLLQERSPIGARGRVIGTFNAVAIGTLPIGTLIGGFLLNGPGLVPTLAVIAAGTSTLALSLYAVPAFRELSSGDSAHCDNVTPASDSRPAP